MSETIHDERERQNGNHKFGWNDAIFRTVRHGFVDAGGHCCDTRSYDNDTALRMGFTLRFRHEGKPFRRCAKTGIFYFAFY